MIKVLVSGVPRASGVEPPYSGCVHLGGAEFPARAGLNRRQIRLRRCGIGVPRASGVEPKKKLSI